MGGAAGAGKAEGGLGRRPFALGLGGGVGLECGPCSRSTPCGAIAQLGERVVRNDEVGSSILPGSTTIQNKTACREARCFVLGVCWAFVPDMRGLVQ